MMSSKRVNKCGYGEDCKFIATDTEERDNMIYYNITGEKICRRIHPGETLDNFNMRMNRFKTNRKPNISYQTSHDRLDKIERILDVLVEEITMLGEKIDNLLDNQPFLEGEEDVPSSVGYSVTKENISNFKNTASSLMEEVYMEREEGDEWVPMKGEDSSYVPSDESVEHDSDFSSLVDEEN